MSIGKRRDKNKDFLNVYKIDEERIRHKTDLKHRLVCCSESYIISYVTSNFRNPTNCEHLLQDQYFVKDLILDKDLKKSN